MHWTTKKQFKRHQIEIHMHVYIPRSFTKEQERVLRNTAGPSRYIENFLTENEFLQCKRLFDTGIKWPGHGEVSKYWGFDWTNGFGPFLTWLKPKIDEILPDWDLDFLAVQEAINPWKVHADIRWYADKIPYKVIMIPMDVEPVSGPVAPDAWPATFTVAFSQRNFLSTWDETATPMIGNTQKNWSRSIDNLQVEGIVPGYSITKDQWLQYFSHMPYEHLEGLTIDAIHHWKPKSLFYWDSTALHCADDFLSKKIKTKRSLMLFSKVK